MFRGCNAWGEREWESEGDLEREGVVSETHSSSSPPLECCLFMMEMEGEERRELRIQKESECEGEE